MSGLYNNIFEILNISNSDMQNATISSLSFESATDISRTVSESIASSVEIYFAWLGWMQKSVNKSLTIYPASEVWKNIETEKLLKTSKQAFNDFAIHTIKFLKASQFDEIEQAGEVVKKSVLLFCEKQKIIETFLHEIFNFEIEMIDIIKSSRKKEEDIPSDISYDDYKNIMDTYEKLLKHSAEFFRLLAILQPDSISELDDIIIGLKKNIGIYVSWLRIIPSLNHKGSSFSLGSD